MKLAIAWLFASTLVITLAGCGKQEEAPLPKPAIRPAIAKPPPVPQASTPAVPEVDATREGALPGQQVVYLAIQKYTSEHQGRAAKDVGELVSKGYLPELPPPPSGKKYVLDQRFAILKVVDK